MNEIKSLDTYEKMLNQPGYKCVYFYSDWCPDCHYSDRYMALLIEHYPKIDFYRVNREHVAMLSNHLNIFGVPSFLIYKDDETIASYIDKARKTIEEVMAFIDKACKEEGCA